MQDNVKTSTDKYEISPLELIFDLGFVFALSQLSEHLLLHLNWYGMAEMIALLIAVYNVWSYTSFGATFIHVGKTQTQWMMLIVMLLGLFMFASIHRAFGVEAWTFVTPFLVCQIGNGLFTTFAETGLKAHYSRMLGWILATTPLWIIGSFADSEERLIWWGIAAGIDILGTWFAHPLPGRVLRSENVEFDAEHMVERCRLFLIIALGEIVVTTGRAISAAPINHITLLTGICSIASIVALWAIYFGGSEHLVLHYTEETTNPILAARLAMNGLIVTVAGLILFAVGIELVIEHPYSGASASMTTLLFGGPILYLISQGWYLWYITRKVPYYRVVGGIILVICGFLSNFTKTYFSLIIVTILLVILSGIITGSVKKNKGNRL
ncbi:low temperature requirement protein A [Bacillus sp. ISL-75]|uniref:low temperature requirement protein A n=1 Tax=Bacillus sp. ISL-75 TaxID=2819137 RepID=UPI001BEC2D00|nr:low temperature requirement protein A [Bacillus sp. ISL-75]MBT2728145.1 low temperature requirement protein A [Bacillus sp. ISL-75]